MKKIFILSFLLAACASQSPRKPASANDGMRALKQLLPAGNYKGMVPGESTPCEIQASYDMGGEVVSGRDANFNFEQGDAGSTECMYSQACFSKVPFVTEISRVEANHFSVRMEAVGGRSKSSKKMSIAVFKERNSTIVTIEESAGLMNLSSVSLACEI